MKLDVVFDCKFVRKNIRYGLVVLTALACSACGVQKNNWATRNYHALVTHYNIYFNGNEAYKEGITKLYAEPKDDYSRILPLYAVGVTGNEKSAQSEMAKAIEKCRKAIKLHSIQKKPKVDRKKLNDPKYQAFLKLEEYNSQLKYAWLLQGKSELNSGDFMGAVATFSYIQRHYATEYAIVQEAKIWQARAYAEMGWLYEAEEILTKINATEVGYKINALYEGAIADLYIKQERYAEAIPYLMLAVEHEQEKLQRVRSTFVLGQLLQHTGREDEAIDYYMQVTKANATSYVMNFNAQIAIAQLSAKGDVSKVLKSLSKMEKDVRNKDYLDQIYFAQGNIHLKQGDEAEAIACYKKAVESSTRNGIDKALVQITLANLYYEQKDYLSAQPYYSDAAQILNAEHEQYKMVSNRAEVLSELAVSYGVVELQDSLQRIAQMPREEQEKVIADVIASVIRQEEEQRQREEEEAYAAQREAASGSSLPNFQSQSSDWYFYNSSLVSKGKSEFARKWGSRRLEDNWRRANKMLLVEDTEVNYDENQESDSVGAGSAAMDNKQPAFYFAQLPTTAARLQQSNDMIASALFDMGNIYYLKLEENALARETFERLQRRYPNHEKIAESYYYCYQMAKKDSMEMEAQVYRNKIMNSYPESAFAAMLSQPNYNAAVSQMYSEQDSLYEATYEAYLKGNFAQVQKNYSYMQQHYQLSSLMPKFAFLNAMSVGKTAPAAQFRAALKDLVTAYPQSDVTAMSKDILALMEQGMEAQKGASHGSLLERREEQSVVQQTEQEGKAFDDNVQTPHLVVFNLKCARAEAERMVYDLAVYNFSKFLVKDFDLKLTKQSDEEYRLAVSGFESMKEAQWYFQMIDAVPSLHMYVLESNYIFISHDNYSILGGEGLKWDDYYAFYQDVILKKMK